MEIKELKEGDFVAVITKDNKKGVGIVLLESDEFMLHVLYEDNLEDNFRIKEVKAVAKINIDWEEAQ